MSKLRDITEASVKSERMELSLSASRAVGEFIRRVSSMTWLCEGAGQMLCKGSPIREPSRTADLMYRPRPSAIRTKRKGDSGSPCLMPREAEKGHEGAPLTRIEKNAEEVRFRIH